MLLFEWAPLFETVGYKLAEGKGLREGWDSKELWKSVEKSKAEGLHMKWASVRASGLSLLSHGEGFSHVSYQTWDKSLAGSSNDAGCYQAEKRVCQRMKYAE